MYVQSAAAILLWLHVGAASAAEPALATFTLRDDLKRTWQHELVFFPVAASVFGRWILIKAEKRAE